MVTIVSCGRMEREQASTKAPSSNADATQYCQTVPIGSSFCQAVVLEAPKQTLRLAVADTEARREHGLMGVSAVPRGQGMLFVFPDATNSERGFWMKNTIVPLDIVFVSTGGIVTEVDSNVAASAPGAPDSKIARRHGIGRFAIELRAWEAEADGIEPGTKLIVPEIAGH